jgi:DHA1 family tetracycline resistance protein-like MFS transporter
MAEPKPAAERQMASTLGALNRHAFLNVTVVTMAIQSEIQLVTDLFGGSVADTALFLSTTSGFVGLTEFLLNPTIGRLSDRFGRRFFLLIGCSYCAVGNTIVGLLPASRSLVAVNRVLSWALLTVSGSVVGSAAVSDCSAPGVDLSVNLGSFFSSFGLGVIVGPAIGGWVLARTGSPQAVYLARAATALFEVLHDLVFLPETLGLRERLQGLPSPKIPPVSIVSPLAFTRLFSGPRTMVKLCVATFLVCWAEGKNTNDLFQLWMKQDVGLGVGNANLMTIVYGVFMFCGGKLFAPAIIRSVGPRAFTSLSLAGQTLGLGLWGTFASRFSLVGGLLLQFISVNVSQACHHS